MEEKIISAEEKTISVETLADIIKRYANAGTRINEVDVVSTLCCDDGPGDENIIDELAVHPNHYHSGTGMEVWDVIEAFTQGLDGVEAFDAGNVIKYICRWHKKNGLQDLKKAAEYLEHLIRHIENSEKENELS